MKVLASKIALASLMLVPALTGYDSVGAQETKQQELNVEKAVAGKPAGNAALDQAALAARLALLGEKQEKPMLLLAAAQLLGELQTSDKDASSVKKTEDDSKDSAGELNTLNYRELLSKAQAMAEKQGDAGKAIIDQIEGLRTKGIVYSQGEGRPSRILQGITFKVMDRDRIDPGHSATYSNVQFEGKKPAIVTVIGDGDGDLDLFVYDGNTGGIIGSDEDRDSIPVVQWQPRYEGPFTIVVKNVSGDWENFVLLCKW